MRCTRAAGRGPAGWPAIMRRDGQRQVAYRTIPTASSLRSTSAATVPARQIASRGLAGRTSAPRCQISRKPASSIGGGAGDRAGR
jgi:hypothetical protein